MKRSEQQYLGSSSLRATADTMAVASSVLGFDIVELWSRDDPDGMVHCTYVHGSDETIKGYYPNVILGHYPSHKREHTISPNLCNLSKQSPERYHWRVVSEQEEAEFQGDEMHSPLHPDLSAPFKTQMAYLVAGETDGADIFIVGFSLTKIPFSSSKLKFLSGLGYAIFVANQDFDHDEQDGIGTDNGQNTKSSTELDVKEFVPRPITRKISFTDAETYAARVYPENFVADSADPLSVPIVLGLSGAAHRHTVATNEPLRMHSYSESTESQAQTPLSTLRMADVTKAVEDIVEKSTDVVTGRQREGSIETTTSGSNQADLQPPVWDPVDEFGFPVSNLPVISRCRNDLTLDDFKDLMHIADGSNSNIFLGLLNGERCIVKLVKESVESDVIVMQEFDVEHAMLARLDHPNIIRILGAGRSPRRFLALEFLGGGTLQALLEEHQRSAGSGLTKRLFRKPSFTYSALLSRARDIAAALDYVHRQVHPGASIIHRDLKPDNIGFTKDGCVKILDFGLCTIVKRRTSSRQAYEMTGNTGSLRYMAPEVALRKAYSEKADVYSFGIMLWQMARDQTPFKGMSKSEFISRICQKGERPKLDHSWPTGFTALLEACWHSDQVQRPSFEEVVKRIDTMIDAHSNTMWNRMRPFTPKEVTRSTSKEVKPNSGNNTPSPSPSPSPAARESPSPKPAANVSAPPPPPRDSRSSWF